MRRCGPGPTTRETARTPCPWTRCWTTSCSTGCRATPPPRPGCTGRAWPTSHRPNWPTSHSTRLELPVGVSIYPRETNRPSRRWVDRWMPNLIHYNILDRGGHFAAWEQPALNAKEIRDCFAKVRRPRQTKLAESGLSRDLIGAVTVKRKEESHD